MTTPPDTVELPPRLLKTQLDDWVARYHHPRFVQEDPLQFAVPFKNDLRRCEAQALLSALLSYGRREVILRALNELYDRLEAPVYDVLQEESLAPLEKSLKGFVYRFNTGQDIINLLRWWKDFYAQHDSHLTVLRDLVPPDTLLTRDDLKPLLTAWLNTWLPPDFLNISWPYGTRYLIPHPATGGACKRFHMALRWLCRNDHAKGAHAVDLGLWSSVIPPSALLMPLDTHVARLSRQWGLLSRKSTDWKAAEILTRALAVYRPEDPCIYDFAFLGYGVDEVRGRLASSFQ